MLDEIFAERDLAEWRELLAEPDAHRGWSCRPRRKPSRDPQVVANDMVVDVDGPGGPIPLVASPAQFDGVAPSLTRAPDHGEHTEEVLLELGRSWDEIVELKERGAVL